MMHCFRMAGMPQFGLAEKAYSAFRPAYPQGLFDRILERVPPDRRRRAVDLGAGTGLSTLPLCRWFSEVVAVEPDTQMAAKIPRDNGRIEVHTRRAEDHDEPAASVDLATLGTSFHWMDGPRVLARVADWLRPGGVLAVYSGGFPRAPAPVQAILERELREHWDAHRHPRLREGRYFERLIRDAPGFTGVEILQVPNTLPFDAGQLAGFCSSTSYGAAYMRTLPGPQEYLKALEEELQTATAGESIPLDLGLELILASKP